VKRYKQVHAPLFILQICTIFPSYSPATGFHFAAHVFPFSLHSHERYLLLVATLPLTNYHYLTRPDCFLGEQKAVLRSCCVNIGTGSSFRFCESTDRKDAQCPCSARRCPLLQISSLCFRTSKLVSIGFPFNTLSEILVGLVTAYLLLSNETMPDLLAIHSMGFLSRRSLVNRAGAAMAFHGKAKLYVNDGHSAHI